MNTVKKSLWCIGLTAVGLLTFSTEALAIEPWPEAPNTNSDSSYLGTIVKSKELPRNYPIDESFRRLNEPPPFRGTIVRAGILAFVKPDKRYYHITFNKIGSSEQKEQQEVTNYFSLSDSSFTAPRFSSDGNKLLFRIGNSIPQRGDGFGIMLWNFAQRTIGRRQRDKNIAPPRYPRVVWSPGNRFFSYLTGGSAVGDYDGWFEPYALTIYDTRNNVERIIAPNVLLEWSWTYHGTLLYLPAQDIEAIWRRTGRPTTYEAGLSGNKPQPLIEGGYFAHASPDNEWIAFCDWPGYLLSDPAKKPHPEVQRGLYLFNRSTKTRVFVGALSLKDQVLMQWSPDGQTLFVSDSSDQEFSLYQLNLADLKDVPENPDEKTLPLKKIVTIPRAKDLAFLTFRGTSPDGTRFYVEEVFRLPSKDQALIPTRRVFTWVDAQTGKQTPFARVENFNDQDWDWHDDSGVNPAFEAAQKLEEALPPIVAAPPAKAPMPKK